MNKKTIYVVIICMLIGMCFLSTVINAEDQQEYESDNEFFDEPCFNNPRLERVIKQRLPHTYILLCVLFELKKWNNGTF